MSKISIKNLDLYYGDFKALKNINLEIKCTPAALQKSFDKDLMLSLSDRPAAENQRC